MIPLEKHRSALFFRWSSAICLIAVLVMAARPGAAQSTSIEPLCGCSPADSPKPLCGFVDMHAHPMSNLAFGGKLIHGAPDIGALIPTDAECRNGLRAINLAHALEIDKATHGGWGIDNPCGDDIRKEVIDNFQKANDADVTPDGARGAPDFVIWPKWSDITHQKMFVEWIRRAQQGGLRVMVALATHNETTAAAVMGPGDGPGDDKASADLQIVEIKGLVSRHTDFMEVALTPGDLRRIVGAGKLAVVLGLEIDNIGNFHRLGAVTPPMVRAELQRLRNDGVRYIFPTHMVDNLFAGTAVYESNFNLSNRHVAGHWWALRCSNPTDGILYQYQPGGGFDLGFELVKAIKLGLAGQNPPVYPKCGPGMGHVNRLGLTLQGESALREMMKMGMLIDIDHMSQKAVSRALEIAEAVPEGGYPLNSGHNGRRHLAPVPQLNENSRTDTQIRRIAALGGMFGLGTANADSPTFIERYTIVASLMGNRSVGMGTDLNGLVKGMPPRSGAITYDASFPQSSLGIKAWDYNTEGVAHYGLLADFIRDLRGLPGGKKVVNTLCLSAEHFAQMWEKAERQKARVP